MMSREERDDLLDERLRALSVYDVEAARADRTLERCRAALSARAASRRRPLGRLLFARGQRWAAVSWTEPLATLAVSALYLVAAVAASLTLFRLGPPR
jgi:hypothetical protein